MGKPAEKKSKKKRSINNSNQATSVEPEGDYDITPSAQASDMMMTDAPSEATLVETQPTEEQVETRPDVPESMPVDGNEVCDFH